MNKKKETCTHYLFILFFYIMVLTSCSSDSWTEEGYQRAIQEYNTPAQELPLKENAAIRYKNLFLRLTDFPDAMQAVDKVCEKGLPPNHGHFKNWVKTNQAVLKQLRRAAQLPEYRLRYEDLVWKSDASWNERLSKMMDLSSLLLIESALKFDQLENSQSIDQALENVFLARKISNHMTQDGTLRDYYVASGIRRRCNQLLSRVSKTLNPSQVKTLINQIEQAKRELGTLEDFHRNQKRWSSVFIMEWLKPLEEDSTFDRMSQESAEELQERLDAVFRLQGPLLKFSLNEVFRQKGWSRLTGHLNHESEFVRSFFGFASNEGRHTTSFVQVRIHLAYMIIGDEMLQLKSRAWLERQQTGQWPLSVRELTQLVKKPYINSKKLPSKKGAGNFKDQFSGQDYGYRVEDDILTLWSYGPDFKDNAGLEPWDGAKGDLIISLEP